MSHAEDLDFDSVLNPFERCVADAFDEMVREGLFKNPNPHTDDFDKFYARVCERFPHAKGDLWPVLLQVRGHGLLDDDEE